MQTYDVIIVGAGIAGASMAYFLAQGGAGKVLVLEKEAQPGYHATGRAAGVLVEFDPVPSILDLKVKGGAFLRDPPAGLFQHPVLAPTGILILCKGEGWSMARSMAETMKGLGVTLRLLSPAQACALVPVVSEENFDGGLFLPEDGRIDVHEILWSYLRHARKGGMELRCGEEVREILTESGRVRGVRTDKGTYRAPWVVNAAGAWAGMVGRMAGGLPLVLTPKRRTIVTFGAPRGLEAGAWPLVADLNHSLYFSPEPGGFLASPMDEDPMEPCDAKPDEFVVATALDRLGRVAPALVPRSIRKKWAGLRTFAPDQTMVVGEDPRARGFFWLAGQGGAGIETSPVVGLLGADLLLTGKTDVADPGFFDPRRFQ